MLIRPLDSSNNSIEYRKEKRVENSKRDLTDVLFTVEEGLAWTSVCIKNFSLGPPRFNL